MSARSRKSKEAAAAKDTYGSVSVGGSSSGSSAKAALLDHTDGLNDEIISPNDNYLPVLSLKQRRNDTSASPLDNDGLMVEKDGVMREPRNTRGGIPTIAVALEEADENDENNLRTPLSNPNYNDNASDVTSVSDDEDDESNPMSIEELLYSSSSYYAIARPVTISMILAALAVVYINTEATIADGQDAMAAAYQTWKLNSSTSNSETFFMSMANALVIVSAICCMTFGIVLLYKFKCMKFLIGYMMFTSATLLGVLGGNIFSNFLMIYNIPLDKVTFYLLMANFAVVGVLSVFWLQGIPKYMTQAYLICTSIILAWHLSYFDDWTTWTLLFMLAVYDLCAVLTPCGPLKALVNLMSKDDAPEMPGLLYEAELPPEAKRPTDRTPRSDTLTAGVAGTRNTGGTDASVAGLTSPDGSTQHVERSGPGSVGATGSAAFITGEDHVRQMKIPLAIAKVYQLPVLSIPDVSKNVLNPEKINESNVSASPLLILEDRMHEESAVVLPENPTPEQLRALVIVRLPATGGRLEQVSKRGKKVYLERDRHGNPKRIIWVDRAGKVFAEMKEDDEDGPERNSIRLGMGDFIFYSVLVAKAAQYSFTTFFVCMLVILAGLGGTLVLLSVYHHALPALPISIFLGVIFYLLTRFFIEPWIEVVLTKPFYV